MSIAIKTDIGKFSEKIATFENQIRELTALVANVSAVPSGGIIMWSGAIVNIPDGYVLCDGNNDTPNLQNRFIVGAGDSYAVGDTGGENTHTLIAGEIPAHTHGEAGSHQHDATGSHQHDAAGNHQHDAAGNHQHNAAGSHQHAATGNHHHTQYEMSSTPGPSGQKVCQNTPYFYHYDQDTSTAGSHQHDAAGSHQHDATGSHQHDAAGSHQHDAAGSHQHNAAGAHTHNSVGGDGAHENRPPYYALAWIMKT